MITDTLSRENHSKNSTPILKIKFSIKLANLNSINTVHYNIPIIVFSCLNTKQNQHFIHKSHRRKKHNKIKSKSFFNGNVKKKKRSIITQSRCISTKI